MTSRRFTKDILLRVTSFCVIVCFLCVIQQSLAFAEPPEPTDAVTDFIAYWAASRLLVNGGNPFSPRAVFELQKSVGYNKPKPLMMWNPPWTLSFILPFGGLAFFPSQFLWLILHVFFILISVQKLWVIYSQTEQKSYLPLVV